MTDFGHEIYPGEIIIKDVTVLRGLMERRYSPLLINIICAVANKFGLIITESYRDKTHMNDLHGTLPVRAVDLRSWCYITDKKAYEIMHWINKKWMYDPNRPDKKVAIIHKTKHGSIHFHIQSSQKTMCMVV